MCTLISQIAEEVGINVDGPGYFECEEGYVWDDFFSACNIRKYIYTNSRKTEYRTRAIITRSRFEAALVYKPQILGFKKESRINGRSAS